MNWLTLHRMPQPADFDPGARRPPATVHVHVEGDTLALCKGIDVLDDDYVDGDHPENYDGLDGCSICWSVLERDRRAERGLPPIPSQRLSWARGAKAAA